jgi:hypothetical protein
MRQKLVLILSFVVLGFHSNAQNAVEWSTTKEKVEKEDNTYLIIFHANITDSWHLYSQHLPSPGAGPLPTEFAFDVNENIELIGKVTEDKDKMHSVMDAFGVQVNYYDGDVTFTQKVKIKSDLASLSGFVYYMICNEIMCVPKDMEFDIVVGR